VDLATADDGHHVVADLLQAQRRLDDLGRIRGDLDRARIAEEVGGVQHVDVERVALDPLAAVDQAPERLDLGLDLDAADRLHRVDRRGLVGNRADATDAGGDVGRLGEVAAA